MAELMEELREYASYSFDHVFGLHQPPTFQRPTAVLFRYREAALEDIVDMQEKEEDQAPDTYVINRNAACWAHRPQILPWQHPPGAAQPPPQ